MSRGGPQGLGGGTPCLGWGPCVRGPQPCCVAGEGLGPWLPAVLEAVLGALEPSGPPRNVELGLSALHSLGEAPEPLGTPRTLPWDPQIPP